MEAIADDAVQSKESVSRGAANVTGNTRHWFVFVAAAVYFVSAVATLTLAQVGGRVLLVEDRLLSAPYKITLHLFSIVQLSISAFLLFSGEHWGRIKLSVITWATVALLSYRFCAVGLGAPDLSSCLGNLSARFAISPATLDWIRIVILSALLAGSSGILVIEWLSSLKSARAKTAPLDAGKNPLSPMSL